MLVACKTMTTVRGLRNAGDPLPEAESWTNLQAYINTREVKRVPGDYPEEVKVSPPIQPVSDEEKSDSLPAESPQELEPEKPKPLFRRKKRVNQ
jgi:hypothetical protein